MAFSVVFDDWAMVKPMLPSVNAQDSESRLYDYINNYGITIPIRSRSEKWLL